MKKKGGTHWFSRVLTIGAILLLLWLEYYPTASIHQSPKAVGGELNLTNWMFDQDGVSLLNGEWDFYPDQLLKPSELANHTPVSIKVPGRWSEKENYQQKNRGNGTYHLSIRLPDSEELLLKVQNVWMSHRLYVNGELVKEMGKPHERFKEHEAKNIPYTVPIQPASEVELVLQVSNYLFYDGGIAHPIQLGSMEEMTMNSFLSFGSDMAGVYLFLVFGIFHLYLYQMRNKEMIYLYSGLHLLLVSLLVATTGEKLLMRLLDGYLSFQITYKLQDLSIFLSMTVLIFFLQSLEPRVLSKKVIRMIASPILCFCVAVVGLPYQFYTHMKPFMTLYIFVMLGWFIVRLLTILIKSEKRQSSSNEFWYVAGIVFFIMALMVNSILYHTGYTNSNVIGKFSTIGFLTALNLFLARRFTNKMNEVQLLSDQLQKSNDIKDEFLARTSHELKTPLHGIINISNHLLKEKQENLSRQKENIALIQDTSMKLSLLVNDLTDAIKLRHEDIHVQMKSVDISVVVQLVFQLLSFNTREKEVRLINDIKPMTFVQADENRLRQVLYNLVANAVKYTDTGQVTATAKREGENLFVSITDTGIGIPKEEWDMVFEDSYRVVSPKQFSDNGMGLGLYISRQLARKMNGDVWVEHSIVGKGTTISIQLLSAKGDELDKESNSINCRQNIKTSSYEKSEHEQQKKRILLVDDEPTNIRVLTLMLEDQFELFVAYRGDHALQLLNEHKVDLVITDVMMPKMSGIELVQLIRENHSILDLPIIMATVRNGEKDIELAYQAGANDYILKPFTEEEIQSRIRVLLKLNDSMEQALQHELAYLQAQINPHFLHNAISNIIAICYEDGDRAAELLASLSHYLRYLFQMDHPHQRIPLYQELELIQEYVELEKLRFSERIHYEVHVTSMLKEEIMIPALLIQPLVENAIRHGLFHKRGEGTVTLTIEEQGEFICMTVEDDGIGMSQQQIEELKKTGKGVGVKNIDRRVQSYHNASFHIHSEQGKGTKCTLLLPKQRCTSVVEVVK
ncbi:ATP-binding protein [Metabacillus iocasae]|uniref:histidine kinase n=1 Tax=Priestia iocasae TaxID=2291674 RepID=A0ABS2QWZ1_9BACI|nr:ATP-binding protein [Metabacillus iocasae]MBM7703995.1 signal transduction histidine kinase [Metabacillus iocasae]